MCERDGRHQARPAAAAVVSEPLELWLWTITDEITKKRRQTRYRMTEEDARARSGDDAVKVEHSLEFRQVGGGNTSDFQRLPPKS